MTRLPRLALLLLAAAGCVMSTSTRWDGIQGSEWTLAMMEGTPVLDGTEVSLTFDVGRLYGKAVNRYSAQYERTDEALKIDTVAATKKFVDRPPGAMDQEQRYLKLLGEADGWGLSSTRLELKRGGTVILVFHPRQPKE